MLSSNTHYLQIHAILKYMLSSNTCYPQIHAIFKYMISSNTCYPQIHTILNNLTHRLPSNAQFAQMHTILNVPIGQSSPSLKDSQHTHYPQCTHCPTMDIRIFGSVRPEDSQFSTYRTLNSSFTQCQSASLKDSQFSTYTLSLP